MCAHCAYIYIYVCVNVIFVLCDLAIATLRDRLRSMQTRTTVYDKHDCALLSRINIYVYSLKCSRRAFPKSITFYPFISLDWLEFVSQLNYRHIWKTFHDLSLCNFFLFENP